MPRSVPFQLDFKTVEKVANFNGTMLIISMVLSILSLLYDQGIVGVPSPKTQIAFTSFICAVSVLYFIIDIVINYSFQLAETKRRYDLIDNSFNTNFADERSEGYFTNDNIVAGIYKLGINCFENSLFTFRVAQKMVPGKFIKAMVVVMLFLVIALTGNNKWLTSVLQLALPLTVLQQAIRVLYFKMYIHNIYEDFKRIFSITNTDIRDSLLIKNVIAYETTLAWATIKLDSKIFNSLNDKVSQDWDNLKIKLNIH
jgi:hypothetical protein